MRVLGIDPGTVTTGWGVVEEHGGRLVRVAGGVVCTRGPLPARLAEIFGQVEAVLARFSPDALSVEKSFVAANVQSAFRLGEARGVVLAAAARAGVKLGEYSPAEIKLAVAGTGRATKDQIQEMVRRLLALPKGVTGDEADALGAAICHLHSCRLADAVGVKTLLGLARTRRGRAGHRWTSLSGIGVAVVAEASRAGGALTSGVRPRFLGPGDVARGGKAARRAAASVVKQGMPK